MEDNKKKKNNFFKYVLYFIFGVFICVMAINASGYSKLLNSRKTMYTEEQISEFEKAVSSGEQVDLKEFLKYDEKDFSNGFSDLGVDISTLIDKGSSFIFNYIIKIFEILFK